jgi:hypothetical protein
MGESENSSGSSRLLPSSFSRDLVVVEPAEAASAAEPPISPAHTFSFSRFHVAAAAALAIVGAVAGALLLEDRQQAQALAEQASENAALAGAVKSLKVRLDAIDAAAPSAELAELRQSIGQIKSAVVSPREFSGALAQLSQRVDKLDREGSVKFDKLTERDHEASASTAGLSARIDKLEQKIAAPPLAAALPVGQAKQLPNRPKLGNVSMDTTSSIERPRPVLRGYVVLDARDDIALVGGRYGEREVRQGDILPGAGRVERIELRGDGWVVMTSEGLIASAEAPRY